MNLADFIRYVIGIAITFVAGVIYGNKRGVSATVAKIENEVRNAPGEMFAHVSSFWASVKAKFKL